jgi:hypothetical protein
MTMADSAATDVLAELRKLIIEFLRRRLVRDRRQAAVRQAPWPVHRGRQLIRNTSGSPEICTEDEFIAPRQRMVESGELTCFREVESKEITEVFGNVAHRFSTYDKRGVMNGTLFDGKGVISTQFVRPPNGWKMSCMGVG